MIVNLFELIFLFPNTLLVIVLQQRESNHCKIILTANYFKERHIYMYLLTEQEGQVGKYLAQGADIQLECSKVGVMTESPIFSHPFQQNSVKTELVYII